MALPLAALPKHGLHYAGGFTLGVIASAIISGFNASILFLGIFVIATYYLFEKYAYQNGTLGCQAGKMSFVNPLSKPVEKKEGV